MLLVLATLSVVAVGLLVGRLVLPWFGLGSAPISTAGRPGSSPAAAGVPAARSSWTRRNASSTASPVAHRSIVITRGALEVLDAAQLDAVLAHERAHLAERHHLLLAASRALAAVLPRLRLFRAGAASIARLVEMRADDVAARRHPGSALVGALLALSDVGPLSGSALGASTVGVVDRVERLLAPPAAGPAAPLRLALLLAVIGLFVGPVLAAAAVTLVPSLCPFPLP
jgi:hypothetical protein